MEFPLPCGDSPGRSGWCANRASGKGPRCRPPMVVGPPWWFDQKISQPALTTDQHVTRVRTIHYCCNNLFLTNFEISQGKQWQAIKLLLLRDVVLCLLPGRGIFDWDLVLQHWHMPPRSQDPTHRQNRLVPQEKVIQRDDSSWDKMPVPWTE